MKTTVLVGSVKHAIRQKEQGVDIIVAQGTEAGGHTGAIASMVLIPGVVDAVALTPVLGAGGIGRGRQAAAALAVAFRKARAHAQDALDRRLGGRGLAGNLAAAASVHGHLRRLVADHVLGSQR